MALRFYFLLATLLTLPFAVRKVIWVDSAPFFKEYTDISVYAFEVFLFGYVLLSILQHKKELKSIYNKLFHVEHLLIVFLLSLSTLLAAFFQESYYGLYFVLRWILYVTFASALYLDLCQIVPRGTLMEKIKDNCSTWNIPLVKKFKKLFHVEQLVKPEPIQNCSTWNNLRSILLISLIFQAFLILIQVLSQHSLGLIYLGEVILHPSIAGVATIIIQNQEILRGYGTFLHPNIAAFFFFTYGISYILLSIVPRGTFSLRNPDKNCSTWNIPLVKKFKKLFHVEQSSSLILAKIVPRGTIALILLGFILTFSKSVIGVSLILAFLAYIWLNCSTWNNSKVKSWAKLFHVEHSGYSKFFRIVPRGTILGVLIIIGLFLIVTGGIPDFIKQSILERKSQYLSIPVNSVPEILIGQGLGNYTEALAEKSPGLFYWQLQPIHNVYVLLLIELGLLPILGISVYMWLKWRKYLNKYLNDPSLLQKIVLSVTAGIASLLAVDHYMWDIEQGQFLFLFLITILVFTYHSALPKNRE